MSRDGVVEKLTRGIVWDPTHTDLCTVKELGQSGGVDVPSQGRSISKAKRGESYYQEQRWMLQGQEQQQRRRDCAVNGTGAVYFPVIEACSSTTDGQFFLEKIGEIGRFLENILGKDRNFEQKKQFPIIT